MFRPVAKRHTSVLIVLGGESIKGFDFSLIHEDITIITCNFVVDHIPRADYWISIDTGTPRTWLPRRPRGPYYFFGVPDGTDWLPRDVHPLRRMPRGDDNTLCHDKTQVRTGSSGYAALNLAHHFHAPRIGIIGLDGAGGHFYNPGENLIEPGHRDPVGYLHSFPGLFAAAVPQLNARGCMVINGSLRSTVDCFPRAAPEDVVKWLNMFQ